jgi:hypothetical protein
MKNILRRLLAILKLCALIPLLFTGLILVIIFTIPVFIITGKTINTPYMMEFLFKKLFDEEVFNV